MSELAIFNKSIFNNLTERTPNYSMARGWSDSPSRWTNSTRSWLNKGGGYWTNSTRSWVNDTGGGRWSDSSRGWSDSGSRWANSTRSWHNSGGWSDSGSATGK